MTTPSAEMLADDLDLTATDMPASITHYKGTLLATAVVGTMSAVGRENDVQDEGVLKTFDAEWVGTITDFVTVPLEQDTITIGGVSYYVDRREDDPAGVGITMFLKRDVG